MRKRTLFLVVAILATVAYTRFLSDVHAVPLRASLDSVPEHIGPWRARSIRLQERIVKVVGVEDYLLREYVAPDGFSVGVYVGYYEQQREGDQIHSPKHCLPGAGWRPVQNDRISFDTPDFNGGSTRTNRYVVQKGQARQLAFYWYQSRGRNITSEYWAKVWLVADSVLRKRNDGALIRLTADIPSGAGVEPVQERLVTFAQKFLPQLARSLPE